MPDSRFKPYQQNQLRLLPLDLSEMVPENHMARVIDRVVFARIKIDTSLGGIPTFR